MLQGDGTKHFVTLKTYIDVFYLIHLNCELLGLYYLVDRAFTHELQDSQFKYKSIHWLKFAHRAVSSSMTFLKGKL